VRALLLVACAACLPPVARDADNAVDLRYRMNAALAPAHSTVVDIYRTAGDDAPSRCKMVPTDSQAFAIRAHRCGGMRAWYWGVARLFLEQANSSRFAHAIRLDDRLRWIDEPGACEESD
jgi:hypothetical protein